MNLSENGWFRNLISSQTITPEGLTGDKSKHIYKATRNSGLIYGHPVLPKEYKSPDFLELPEDEKLKLVLLDGFIKTVVFPAKESIPSEADEFIQYLSGAIIDYYADIVPNNKIKDRNFWGQKLDNEEIVESLLNDRLTLEDNDLANFWVSFFNNSLLFLDVFFFGEWLTNRHEEASVQKIQEHRDKVHLLLLQVMACAALADNAIQEEEKMLFNQFLTSAHLPENMEIEAANYMNHGVSITDIDLSSAKTWLLKKYILELAILTIWADQIVNEDEKEFIGELSDLLGFTRDELDTSMVAIETFAISNWGNIPFLQEKNSFSDISSRFVSHLSKVLDKNKKRIDNEINERKELTRLLSKSVKEDLTDEEQIMVRTQLLNILKMLPTFVIIGLPGSFLTLPLLLKILPKSTLPSAFQE